MNNRAVIIKIEALITSKRKLPSKYNREQAGSSASRRLPSVGQKNCSICLDACPACGLLLWCCRAESMRGKLSQTRNDYHHSEIAPCDLQKRVGYSRVSHPPESQKRTWRERVVKEKQSPQLTTFSDILIYIYMAKASFSAYVLVKNVLKIEEKVHFSTKKSTTNFGLPFCFFPFPFFASKWLKYAVFAFKKPKKVGRKRGLRLYIYIYIYSVASFIDMKCQRKSLVFVSCPQESQDILQQW